MYGSGQSMPQPPVPPSGGSPGHWPGPPQPPGGHPPAQWPGQAPYGQPPQQHAPPPGYPQGQPPYQPQLARPRSATSGQATLGLVLTVTTAAVMVVTGVVNAVSGPWGYVNDANIGVLVTAGDPLVLAVLQTLCGLGWLVFGILLFVRPPAAWGGALAVAFGFATYESFFVVRGAVIHFIGLFLAIAVLAVLAQDPVRKRCQVGPPAR